VKGPKTIRFQTKKKKTQRPDGRDKRPGLRRGGRGGVEGGEGEKRRGMEEVINDTPNKVPAKKSHASSGERSCFRGRKGKRGVADGREGRFAISNLEETRTGRGGIL